MASWRTIVNTSLVLDNLIHSGEMPITIGVFVDPGHTGPLPDKPGWEPRPANRSIVYDTVSDVYALFLSDFNAIGTDCDDPLAVGQDISNTDYLIAKNRSSTGVVLKDGSHLKDFGLRCLSNV